MTTNIFDRLAAEANDPSNQAHLQQINDNLAAGDLPIPAEVLELAAEELGDDYPVERVRAILLAVAETGKEIGVDYAHATEIQDAVLARVDLSAEVLGEFMEVVLACTTTVYLMRELRSGDPERVVPAVIAMSEMGGSSMMTALIMVTGIGDDYLNTDN